MGWTGVPGPMEHRARPLLRVLLLTTGTVALLGAVIIWAAYGLPGSAAGTQGGVKDGIREVPVRVYAWGFNPRVVYVNPGDTVRFAVLSEDIQHGFAINELGINLQLLSGKEIRSSAVQVDLPAGKYTIHCSIFCGIGHPSMKAKLVVGKPGPAPGSWAPWVASLLSLAAAAALAGFAAAKQRPGA